MKRIGCGITLSTYLPWVVSDVDGCSLDDSGVRVAQGKGYNRQEEEDKSVHDEDF